MTGSQNCLQKYTVSSIQRTDTTVIRPPQMHNECCCLTRTVFRVVNELRISALNVSVEQFSTSNLIGIATASELYCTDTAGVLRCAHITIWLICRRKRFRYRRRCPVAPEGSTRFFLLGHRSSAYASHHCFYRLVVSLN